jgi:hypothetical protein
MSYLTCPRCGLTVRVLATLLTPECCPRCVAHHRMVVQLLLSDTSPSSTGRARSEIAANRDSPADRVRLSPLGPPGGSPPEASAVGE